MNQHKTSSGSFTSLTSAFSVLCWDPNPDWKISTKLDTVANMIVHFMQWWGAYCLLWLNEMRYWSEIILVWACFLYLYQRSLLNQWHAHQKEWVPLWYDWLKLIHKHCSCRLSKLILQSPTITTFSTETVRLVRKSAVCQGLACKY